MKYKSLRNIVGRISSGFKSLSGLYAFIKGYQRARKQKLCINICKCGGYYYAYEVNSESTDSE